MPTETAERFMRALQQAEQSNDVAPLVELFSDDAELRSIGHSRPFHGREEAAAFWREYLHVFNTIRSTFTRVTEQENRSVLEWVSEGELTTGAPIRYAGVSVIETEDKRVRSFQTYYDSAVFLPQAARHA